MQSNTNTPLQNRFVMKDGNVLTSIFFIVFIIGGLAIVGGTFFLFYAFYRISLDEQVLFDNSYYYLIGFLLFLDINFLFFVLSFFKFFKRYGKPLMTLDATGITLPNFANQILWSQVKSYKIYPVGFGFISLYWRVTFNFNDDFNQDFIKSGRSHARYNKKKKRLNMTVYGVSGHMSANKVRKIIGSYQG